MKLFLLIFVNFIFINKIYSQTFIEIEIGSKRKITKIDVKGTIADADTAWRKFIMEQLSTSIFKGAKRGKYTVSVGFIVAKDGSIADVKCENDPGYGMCKESIRIIKKSSKLVPGPVRPVRSTYIVDSLKVKD